VKSPRTEAARREDETIVFGVLGAGVVGFIVYPPLLIGLALGLVCFALSRPEGESSETLRNRRQWGVALLVIAVLIGTIAWALEQGPMGGETDRFVAHWHPRGPKLIDFSALLRFPWGWIPASAAITFAVGGIATLVRSQR
jgi:nitric oxide reductase large subunit